MNETRGLSFKGGVLLVRGEGWLGNAGGIDESEVEIRFRDVRYMKPEASGNIACGLQRLEDQLEVIALDLCADLVRRPTDLGDHGPFECAGALVGGNGLAKVAQIGRECAAVEGLTDVNIRVVANLVERIRTGCPIGVPQADAIRGAQIRSPAIGRGWDVACTRNGRRRGERPGSH